jgi:hypothetical protein
VQCGIVKLATETRMPAIRPVQTFLAETEQDTSQRKQMMEIVKK